MLAEIIIFSNFPRPTTRKWHRIRICIHSQSFESTMSPVVLCDESCKSSYIHTSFISMCLAHIATSCDPYSFTLHKISELQSSALAAPMHIASGPTTLALFWKIRTKYSENMHVYVPASAQLKPK